MSLGSLREISLEDAQTPRESPTAQDVGIDRPPIHPVLAVAICLGIAGFSYLAEVHESPLGLIVVGAVCSIVVIVLLRLSIFDLLIVTIPTSIYFGGDSAQVNTSVSDIVLLLALVQFFFDTSLKLIWRSIRSKALVVVIAVLVMLAAMTLPVLIWPRSEFNVQYYLLDAFKLLIVIFYFVVTVAYCVRALKKHDYRFVYVWISVAVIESVLGIIGSLFSSEGTSNYFSYSIRAVGTFTDPNSYAIYLISSICLVWFAFRLSEKRRVLLCALPMVIGTLFSGSRAGLIVLGLAALGIALMILLVPLYRKVLIPLAVFMSLSTYVAFNLLSGNPVVERGLSTTEDDIRWKLADAAIQMWADSPVIGIGLGQFRSYSDGYLDFTNSHIVHNTYLSFFAEGGYVAGMLYLFVLLFIGKSLWGTVDPGKYPFLLGILTFAAMSASINLQNFRPLWVFLGLALGWSIWIKGEGQRTRELRPSYPSVKEI